MQPSAYMHKDKLFLVLRITNAHIQLIASDTVDGERFTGLNIHGCSTIKVLTKILSRCLGHKYSLFRIIKERHYIHGKTFMVVLKTVKNAKV